MCRSLKSSQDVTKFTSHQLGRTKLSLIIMLYWTVEITRLRLGPRRGKNKIVLPQRISVKRQQKLKKNTQKIEICDFEVAHDMKHNYSPPKLITYRLFSYFRKNQDRFRYLDFKVVFIKDAIAYWFHNLLYLI